MFRIHLLLAALALGIVLAVGLCILFLFRGFVVAIFHVKGLLNLSPFHSAARRLGFSVHRTDRRCAGHIGDVAVELDALGAYTFRLPQRLPLELRWSRPSAARSMGIAPFDELFDERFQVIDLSASAVAMLDSDTRRKLLATAQAAQISIQDGALIAEGVSPGSLPEIVTIVHHCVRLITHLGARAALPVASTLEKIFHEDPSVLARASAVRALSRLSVPEWERVRVKALASPSPMIQLAAAVSIPSAELLDELVRDTKHPPEVLAEARAALAAFRSKQGLTPGSLALSSAQVQAGQVSILSPEGLKKR